MSELLNTPADNEAYTDENAIPQAAQGDAEAFGYLYQKYVTAIFNYTYYRTGNQHDAEDITARVFHRAFGHMSSYKYMGVPFSAWLYRIAHNLVANYHRDSSRKREVSLEDHLDLHTPSDHPEAVLVINQDNEALLSAIRKLTPDRQQLLILKYVEHLSNSDIAVIMGRSEGAIKSLYHRTLQALKTYLGEYEH